MLVNHGNIEYLFTFNVSQATILQHNNLWLLMSSHVIACVTWSACFYAAYVSITPHYTYSSDELSFIALCMAVRRHREEVPAHRRGGREGGRDAWEKQARERGGVAWRGGRDGVKTDRDIYIDTARRGGVTSLSQWLSVSQGIPCWLWRMREK